MSVAIITCDRVIHDEIGYTVIASAVCIYSMQGISTTAVQIQIAARRVDGYMGIIMPIICVKVLYLALTAFLEEILFNVHSASKESKYPPVFALQLSEDLIIGTLYLQESLSSEFASSLMFLTFVNLVRDAGWVAEIYCRYLKGLKDEKEVAIYMGDKYFQVQQNIVAEFIALSCIFILVLTEYIINGFRSPLFTAHLSRSNREELLMVYALSIIVRIPTEYAAWKIFKARLKSLRAALEPAELTKRKTNSAESKEWKDSKGYKTHWDAPEGDISSHANNYYPLGSNAQISPVSINDGVILAKNYGKSSDKTNAAKYENSFRENSKASSKHMLQKLRQGKIVNNLLEFGHFTRATKSYW
eukprot:CAMPEP_0114500454 /NCGR_PEP_ID=MMETSP0109-20121206/7972_1 /TAXON_ID=29199 /ORGANISM="Chlorarachnion reptans, Strain CCCM449" /LENGTH=358 /DNA_ID=CAMNT_0001678115 /DNA_START=842 /DNA_END=1915 /DNA_ORIENTATION=+